MVFMNYSIYINYFRDYRSHYQNHKVLLFQFKNFLTVPVNIDIFYSYIYFILVHF